MLKKNRVGIPGLIAAALLASAVSDGASAADLQPDSRGTADDPATTTMPRPRAKPNAKVDESSLPTKKASADKAIPKGRTEEPRKAVPKDSPRSRSGESADAAPSKNRNASKQDAHKPAPQGKKAGPRKAVPNDVAESKSSADPGEAPSRNASAGNPGRDKPSMQGNQADPKRVLAAEKPAVKSLANPEAASPSPATRSLGADNLTNQVKKPDIKKPWQVVTPGPVAEGPWPLDLQATRIDVWVMNPGDSQFGPGEIFTHSQVRLVVRYKNAGTDSLSTQSVFYKLTSGPDIDWGTLSGSLGNSMVSKQLAPNQEDYGVLPFVGPGQLAAGTYTVTMKVDSSDHLQEGNESNNTVSATFTVKPSTLYSGKADLTTSVSVAAVSTEAKCSTKRKYDLTAKVQNVGTFPAYLHGNGVVTVDGPATTDHNEGYYIIVNPGQSKSITFRAEVEPAQSRQFTFTADAWKQVPETSEANNSSAVNITAPPVDNTEKGDLVIDSAFFKYTPTNKLYWLEVKLKNQGSVPVTVCDSGIWRTVNAPQGFAWMANAPQYPKVVQPGEVFQGYTSARQTLPQGTFSITIEANADHKVPETNYGNNTHTFTVRVPEDVQGL